MVRTRRFERHDRQVVPAVLTRAFADDPMATCRSTSGTASR
jgi:hypothetical protein